MGYTQPHPSPSTMSGTWWAMVLRGIVAVLFGSAALLWPELTLFVLLVCFGVYALIDGLLAIVAGIRASEGRRWLLLAEGAIGCLAGLVVLVWPGETALVLVYAISAWAIFTGLLKVIMAVSFRRQMEDVWLMGLGGALSVLFGIILGFLPGAGLVTLVWLIGIYALILGLALVVPGLLDRGHPEASASMVK
ncbi:MAG TPA: HdeD family acid-resistance protein [Rubrobacter sp.]|nr:HdeD family acid-resistance protein [Rubrobacter sp.]